MKSTQYLYGCSATAFAALPYKSALVFKIDRAKQLLYELVYEHYTVRDDHRITAIGKAISFNQSLLEELT